MAIRSMPSAAELAAKLTDLLGKTVDAGKGKPLVISPKTPAVVGVYHRDDGAIGAVWAAELTLAANAGAALAMIPPGIAAESIRANKLAEDLIENFREVLNVGASFLNVSGEPHLTFKAAHESPPALPADVATLMAKPAGRLDLDVKVSGYGGGLLSLYVS